MAWGTVGRAAFSVLVFVVAYRACSPTEYVAQPSPTPRKAEQAPVVVPRIDCHAELGARKEAYNRFMKEGRPWLAATELRACAKDLNDPSLAALVKAADVSSYDEDISNKSASAFDRLRAYEGLARDYPEEAKRHAGKLPALRKQLERESAANERMFANVRQLESVRIGMSASEARASSWGNPEKINRTINQYGTREQWVYGGGRYLYFEDGKLTTIQD